MGRMVSTNIPYESQNLFSLFGYKRYTQQRTMPTLTKAKIPPRKLLLTRCLKRCLFLRSFLILLSCFFHNRHKDKPHQDVDVLNAHDDNGTLRLSDCNGLRRYLYLRYVHRRLKKTQARNKQLYIEKRRSVS